MTRGSAADRLYAEAMKNASESWGLGAYLDDQVAVTRYLWDNRHSLSDEMEGEIRKLAGQYKKELAASPQIRKISQEQAARLWAIARSELKLSDSDVRSVFAGFNIESTAEIPAASYDKVIEGLRNYATKF